MKSLIALLIELSCAKSAKEDYPSYNFCKVFDPADYAKIIPDMGLFKDSWPRNDGINPDYVDKGQIVSVSGLDMYVVGSGETAIIWNYDVFGFDAGRTRQYWYEFNQRRSK